MKLFLLLISYLTFSQLTLAQNTDSLNVKTRTIDDTSTVHPRHKKLKITLQKPENKSEQETDSVKIIKPVKFPTLVYGIYIEHIDFGLSKYHTGNNFDEPVGYEFLNHESWRTHTFGLDILQLGLRLNPGFKIMLSAGMEWNHIRLRNSVDILPDKETLSAVNSDKEFIKNRLTSKYIRIPIYAELRTKQNKYGKRTSVVFGPEIGILLNGKLKQKTEQDGKIKIRDDFNFAPIRYGASIRVGHGITGLYAKYFFSDVFANNEGPNNYKNLSFGLTFGF